MHGAAYKHLPAVVQVLGDAGAKTEIWNHKDETDHRRWRSPRAFSEG